MRDIPFAGQRLCTWIEYPNRAERAPVVIVMSHEAGLDDWMRAVADQLATDGFIAVAPDILSGRGPNGGNFDDFRFPADVIRANRRKVDVLTDVSVHPALRGRILSEARPL